MTEVVLGKYGALLVVFLAPMAVIGVYPLILSAFGNVYLPAAYSAWLGFFLLGAALLAIGMFISSLTESQAVAAGLCFLVMLVNYFITSLAGFISTTAFASFASFTVVILALAGIVWFMTRSGLASGVLALVLEAVLLFFYAGDTSAFEGLFPEVMENLSLFDQFYQFVNGVFDLRAVVLPAQRVGAVPVSDGPVPGETEVERMKLPWKKENAAHKAPGGGKRRSFDLKAAPHHSGRPVGGYSVAAAAIVIAIIVAANALVRALPAQWTQFDTTSSQLFSISDQTESIVGSLETPVTIHWIVQSGQEDATLETLLERYQGPQRESDGGEGGPGGLPHLPWSSTDVGSVYNNSLIVESEARYRYVDYYDIYEYDYTTTTPPARGHELRRGGGHYQRRQLCGQRRPAQGLHPHRPRGGLSEL